MSRGTNRRRNYNRQNTSLEKLAFMYPVPPDKLDLFTKHGYVERPKTAAVGYLEHMLTKTSLTAQKASHENIEDIGEQLYKQKVLKFQKEKEFAVRQSIDLTTRKLQNQFKQELHEKLTQAGMEKEQALEKHQTYYEDMACRTESNRDLLENERRNQLILKMTKEKEDALRAQWELAERVKAEAIEAALIEQHKRLRAKAALEREEAVAQALRVARERSKYKLQQEVAGTQYECQNVAEKMLEQQRKLHKAELRSLNERIAQLTKESRAFHEHEKAAQKDFVGIESDYSKFLDLTDSAPCHSDYLISPRKHLHGIAASRLNRQSQTNLIALEQDTRTIQTDVQICATR